MRCQQLWQVLYMANSRLPLLQARTSPGCLRRTARGRHVSVRMTGLRPRQLHMPPVCRRRWLTDARVVSIRHLLLLLLLMGNLLLLLLLRQLLLLLRQLLLLLRLMLLLATQLLTHLLKRHSLCRHGHGGTSTCSGGACGCCRELRRRRSVERCCWGPSCYIQGSLATAGDPNATVGSRPIV